MEKIHYIIIAIIYCCLDISCNEKEFLNEIPISELSTESFFKTSDQFEQAVNAAYSNLRILAGDQSMSNGDGALWAMGEMRSDNSTFQLNDQENSGHPYYHLDYFNMLANNSIVRVTWDNCYQGIGKCNIVLKYSDGIEFNEKERYVAEVKFLRAFYYFTLVKAFGDVPLVTEPVTSYKEAFEGNKRISKDRIYAQIISDLEDAKQNLPLSYSASDFGRATQGAARTLLAKVLMWQNQYKAAANELEIVLNSDQYKLLEDYSSVFNIDNENNAEIIFSIQFMEGPYGQGSANMYRFTPWNAGTKYLPFQNVARSGMNIPTEDLINSFEKEDNRFMMIDTSYIDEKFGTYHGNRVPFTRKFWDPNHSTQLVTGTDFPVFRFPHVLLMLAECYLREGGGDPLPLVNEVRNRAGLPVLNSITLDQIIHERRIEFHCEADRWDVLVRTGKALEVMRAHGEQERKNRPDHIRANAFNEIKLLFPIPTSVLENDPSMSQNEEYK